MIFKKVGNVVEAGNDVGIGEMSGANEVEVSLTVVSNVVEVMIETGTDEVETF